MITVFTIPIFSNLALKHFLGQNAALDMPIGQTMVQIFLITLLPIGIGMTIRQRFPNTASRMSKVMSRVAAGLLALIIVLLVVREGSKLPGFILQVGVGVLLLNVLSMLAGFSISKLLQLPPSQQICIAIEVGISNGTLALAITAGLLNNPEMAIPAAVYSLLMYVTGFGTILYGRKVAITEGRA